jgi:hypothetical protein
LLHGDEINTSFINLPTKAFDILAVFAHASVRAAADTLTKLTEFFP